MRVILVDDEKIALKLLESELSSYEDIQIVGSYTDPKLALDNLETTDPDVIFLDIEMGPHNGLEMAEEFIRVKESLEIVFVTAYSQYAIDAFELNAIDYILKPIQKNRFHKTIRRLSTKVNRVDKDKVDNILKVTCFGSMKARNSHGQSLNWRTRKTKELFAYILTRKEKQAYKDLIMETIFPEKPLENANTLFHTTIYQLRRNLRELGFNKNIAYSNGCYKLSLPIDSDFEKLDKIINLKEHGKEDISKIIDIYKGDFLQYEGYHWAFGIQQTYMESVLEIVDDFTKVQLEKNLDSPILIEALELIYKMEPYDDNIAQNIIAYYGKQRQIKKMKAFFLEHKKNLWEELEVEPMEDLVELFDKYSQED